MAGSLIVAVEGLRKVYRSRRRGDTVAVDGVSFAIEPNEVVGLLGPNGAGKTTTIKCLATLVRPTGGRVEIDGVDAVRRPRAAVERIGAVLEGNRNIYWRLSVRENMRFFAALQGIPPRSVLGEIDRLIERFGLGGKADTPARMLSKGMQQKLSLACALIRGTPLLVLDEPTLGLDVEASYELRAHLKEIAARGERTILFSSHDMAVVQDVCERVIVINEGRVVTDDRVSNLLALFRARAWWFEVAGRLDPRADGILRDRFPGIRIEPDGELTHLTVDLLEPDRFYEVVDVLRDAGAQIGSVQREEPNLEQVFLRLVRGEVG